MKNLFNDLSDDVKKTILEKYDGELNVNTEKFKKLIETRSGEVKPLVNEDDSLLPKLKIPELEPGYTPMTKLADKKTPSYTPGYKKQQILKRLVPVNLDLSGIKTGSDQINPTDSKVKKLILDIGSVLNDKSVTGKINVIVTGGASAVGSKQGYDNKGLALRRANNLIDLIKKSIPGVGKKFTFTPKGVVGGESTSKLNSPEALKAQFVKINFNTEAMDIVPGKEVDSTSVILPSKGLSPEDGDTPVPLPPLDIVMKRVCIRIPEHLVDEFKQKVLEFKKENNLKSIPFGSYDIKK